MWNWILGHCTWQQLDNCFAKIIILNAFFFAVGGAVFIMNSKVQLRKSSSKEYLKAILHHFVLIYSRAFFNCQWMCGAETSLWFDQSVTSIGGERANSIGKFITWRGNSTLNCTRKPISHESRSDSCDIGFQVQFNVEFSSQVMNFPWIA